MKSLSCKHSILCRAGDSQPNETVLYLAKDLSERSSSTLALWLENFEAMVRVERLDMNFLRGRAQWLQELRGGRHSYSAVAHAAQALLDAIRTPPERLLVIASLKQSSRAARKVSGPLWAMIMEGVGGVKQLHQLLRACTEHYAGGGPAKQLCRAIESLAWCASALQRMKRLPQLLPGSVLDESSVALGVDVRLCRRGEGRAAEVVGTIQRFEAERCYIAWADTSRNLPRAVRLEHSPLEVVEVDPRASLEAEWALWSRMAAAHYWGRCACGRSLKPPT